MSNFYEGFEKKAFVFKNPKVQAAAASVGKAVNKAGKTLTTPMFSPLAVGTALGIGGIASGIWNKDKNSEKPAVRN